VSEVQTTPALVIDGYDELVERVGQVLGTSDWVTVDQSLIDGFAAVTGDDYWGHVDPDRAASTPFGGTIAHGLLTLALHPRFLYSLVEFRGFTQMFHYGYDRVRFPAPLPAGARVRATATLLAADSGDDGVRATIRFFFESDAVEKPVCVADYVQFFTL
jgi:acyl dehydratase